MFIAVDANFRLKRRAVSSNERDPALGSGWGYFVEDVGYRNHVLSYADQEDVSQCLLVCAVALISTHRSAHVLASRPSRKRTRSIQRVTRLPEWGWPSAHATG